MIVRTNHLVQDFFLYAPSMNFFCFFRVKVSIDDLNLTAIVSVKSKNHDNVDGSNSNLKQGYDRASCATT